ncbi:MAG: hypothetical protein GEU74_12145 [Nitriliruptorales bacterium]|nr:hypothetical protein [Nitriliruptorales bacterium]
MLEDIGIGNRLQRGRTYARKGQVISMDVGPGSVTAQVQGSRARPYRVRIGIAAFGKAEWAHAERALAGDAWYAATLLAGEMPEDIEDVFAGLGFSLFPTTAGELSLDCTCPDQTVPCKHLAATFYLLAESFDDDPFAIFAWRGRERADLLANLQGARSDGLPAADRGEHPGRPLADYLDSYFVAQPIRRAPTPPPTSSTALLDQLPDIALAVRGRELTDLLRPAYQALQRGERGQEPGAAG